MVIHHYFMPVIKDMKILKHLDLHVMIMLIANYDIYWNIGILKFNNNINMSIVTINL